MQAKKQTFSRLYSNHTQDAEKKESSLAFKNKINNLSCQLRYETFHNLDIIFPASPVNIMAGDAFYF